MNRAMSSSALPSSTSPKVKKFFLPMLRANSRTALPKIWARFALEVAEGVDAEAVDVVTGDDVLVGPDQEALGVGVGGQDLLEDVEVAHRVVAAAADALAPEEAVLLQLRRPDEGVTRRAGDVRDVGNAACASPLASRHSTAYGAVVEARLATAGRVAEGVLRVA